MIEKNILSYKTFIFSFIIHLILLTILLFSPVAKGRSKIKQTTYKVSLSYLPVKKIEAQKPAKPSNIEEKTKEKTIEQKVPKRLKETKEIGMKPLTSEKKEEVFVEKEETPSIGGTKVESIDAPYFPFSYYLNQVLSFISSNWYKPPAEEGTFCTIYFVISKTGRIIDSKVENSSGNSAFDRAALRAVLASNPLPPLPYDYYEEKLGIHLRFQ